MDEEKQKKGYPRSLRLRNICALNLIFCLPQLAVAIVRTARDADAANIVVLVLCALSISVTALYLIIRAIRAPRT
jgi:hypothetical protein